MVALSAWHTPPSPPPSVPRAPRGTAPHILLVLRAAELPPPPRDKSLYIVHSERRTTAVEEASIYCTNWPTFAKNQ